MTVLYPEHGAKAKTAIGPVSRSTGTSLRRAQLIAIERLKYSIAVFNPSPVRLFQKYRPLR